MTKVMGLIVSDEQGILEAWINQIAKKEWIAELCGKFEIACNA